jgi:hypothetical protein
MARWWFWALFGLLVAVAGHSVMRLEGGARTLAGEEMPVYLPQAKYLRVLSLGYKNVLADILWFRTISYFGQHYRSDRNYPWLAYMCDQVTDLDPGAEHVYRFAGMILPWEARDPDEGIRLMEKGARNLPDSWQLPYWLGFTYYFFKNDYRAAVSHLRRAAKLPGAQANVGRLLGLLVQDRYGPNTTLQFLAEMEASVTNEEVLTVIRAQREEARFALLLQHLEAAVAVYQHRYGYTPTSFEPLVKSGILPAVPVDPFGGVFLIDSVTGKVRSSTGHEPSKLHRSRRRNEFVPANQDRGRQANDDANPQG